MGTILRAECQCGYSVEVFVGSGFVDFQNVYYAPAPCKFCQEIVTRNYLKAGRQRCPHCRRATLFYDHPSLRGEILCDDPNNERDLDNDRRFILPDATYYCPECKQMQLHFFEAGCWD